VGSNLALGDFVLNMAGQTYDDSASFFVTTSNLLSPQFEMLAGATGQPFGFQFGQAVTDPTIPLNCGQFPAPPCHLPDPLVLRNSANLVVGTQITDPIFGPVPGQAYYLVATMAPITPVPEPGTWLLVGSGLIAVAGVRRRKSDK
jgi:hypothetical protein